MCHLFFTQTNSYIEKQFLIFLLQTTGTNTSYQQPHNLLLCCHLPICFILPSVKGPPARYLRQVNFRKFGGSNFSLERAFPQFSRKCNTTVHCAGCEFFTKHHNQPYLLKSCGWTIEKMTKHTLTIIYLHLKLQRKCTMLAAYQYGPWLTAPCTPIWRFGTLKQNSKLQFHSMGESLPRMVGPSVQLFASQGTQTLHPIGYQRTGDQYDLHEFDASTFTLASLQLCGVSQGSFEKSFIAHNKVSFPEFTTVRVSTI